MKWISSTRKFKNGIERLWNRIHGSKVTVTEVQQNELSRSPSSSNPALTPKGPANVPPIIGTPRIDVGNSSKGSGWRDATPNHLSACLSARTIPPINQRPLSSIRAVQKMKHGHQSKEYRRSVRANVKPEEEEVS